VVTADDEGTPVGEQPCIPDYSGPCVSNLTPALLQPGATAPGWLPAPAAAADQVVLLVLDGLGWEQLQDRSASAPTMASMTGGPISTVAPSTTATALTSIATGAAPGEHGVIGYRVAVDDAVLNVLRWSTRDGDARRSVPPRRLQPGAPFGGECPPVVTRAEFIESGFTLAHLAGTRIVPYRMVSTLVTEVARLTRSGEAFVYAYYEGIDKVAHEYGLGEHYDAELVAVDRLVADLLAVLPPRAALVVTSDHGQVDVGDRVIRPDRRVLDHVRLQSGEGRFRWLHARSGQSQDLLEAARSAHGDVAWVRTRDEVVDEGWFGPEVSPAARARLGDVALVAREPVSFDDPEDTGLFHLIGRHGSLTSAEMAVPLLAASA
jgi:predicted AlkP superfamily pyrophosphatase or phosphodiesterase